jgi:hypothetical protein
MSSRCAMASVEIPRTAGMPKRTSGLIHLNGLGCDMRAFPAMQATW